MLGKVRLKENAYLNIIFLSLLSFECRCFATLSMDVSQLGNSGTSFHNIKYPVKYNT